jgi:hypothetical protein
VFSILLTAQLLTLATLVLCHRLRERRRQCLTSEEPPEQQPACLQPDLRLSSPRLERQPVCWMFPLLLSCNLWPPPGFPLEPPLLPPILLEFHFSTTMLKFASSLARAMAMSQKLVCFAGSEKQAAQLRVGFPNSPMRCHQATLGDLECHACFNKLVLELVEVRVRGTERVGLDHQQLVIRVVLEFLGHGLRLDAGARLNRRRRCCCLGLFP